MTGNHPEIATTLRQLLIESSRLIEEYTSVTCPDCTNVCCRQRHGLYRASDVRYLHALGIALPKRDETRPLDGPCECLGPQGCVQPRWMRPFKCTWYFCGPLLAALNEGPQKKARRLAAVMQEMIDLHEKLSD